MHGAMIKAFGEPKEVLEVVDVHETASPAAGEVLVGVEYAPVNMNDLYVIQGDSRFGLRCPASSAMRVSAAS